MIRKRIDMILDILDAWLENETIKRRAIEDSDNTRANGGTDTPLR
jgi:predicted transcriptional regulator